MATTFVEYTGDGNATKQFTFPSLQESDVKVRVDGVLKTTSTHYNITSYTTTGGGNVVFTSGNIPSSPANIRIYRDTSVDVAKATYTAGSSVKAADLNNNNTQLLYRAQEEQVPNLIHSYDIDAEAIETSNIKADAITSAKIADDQINSEHYVAGSIDLEHMSANSIDSDQYVDGSIDEAHLSNSAVTQNKLANNSVGTTELINGSVNSDKILDGTIVNADVNASAAIAGTKISPNFGSQVIQTTGNIVVGGTVDGADVAAMNTKLTGIESGATADQTASDIKTLLQSDKLTASEIATGALDGRYFTETELNNGALDGRYFTETEADARYFNISTGDTIKDGQAFPDNDTTIATTAAINDRIIDLVDDVGGFVPIANETSFPTANPDVNNGSGTLVSVKAISSTRTPSSGTVTIANGAGTGNTVTITGCGSTVLTAGFGVIVETTTTLHTYAFHRLVPKATEVTTVAGISSNVTTVANNTSNINAVAADASDIGTVAGAITNVNNVGNSIANVNTTAGSIANVNTVAGNISNVNSVGSNISNVNSVAGNASNINSAVSNASNINSAVSNASNINTVAGSISNVNTTAGSISNVNTVASNISSVNGFFNVYRTGASNPTTSLDTGDLFFNTTSNSLKVYTGSAWVDGVTATGNFAVTTGNTFTGENKYNDQVLLKLGTGDDLQLKHTGVFSIIQNHTGELKIAANQLRLVNKDTDETYLAANDNGAVELNYDNSKKLETTSTGVTVTGDLFFDNPDHAGKDLLFDSSLKTLKFEDGVAAKFGSGSDLSIYHNGSDSFIQNTTGHLRIFGSGTDDKHIYLQPDDGDDGIRILNNGAVKLYHNNVEKFETTSSGVSVTGTVAATSYTGDGSNLSGINTDLVSDTSPQLGGDLASNGNNILMADGDQIKLGTGNDLTMRHNGSSSIIENFTGNFVLGAATSGNIEFQQVINGEVLAKFISNGAVELYHDNNKKFETTSTGVTVTGNAVLTSGGATRTLHLGPSTAGIEYNVNGLTTLQGRTGAYGLAFKTNSLQRMTIASDGDIGIGTTTPTQLGGDGGKVLHIAGANNPEIVLERTTSGTEAKGSLRITDAEDLTFRVQDGSGTAYDALHLRSDTGKVELLYQGSTRFETTAGGTLITGSLGTTDTLTVGGGGHIKTGTDTGKFFSGASNDLQMYHDGTNSYLQNNTGDFFVTNNNNAIKIRPNSAEESIVAHENGAVQLYYNNIKQFETNTDGITVTDDDTNSSVRLDNTSGTAGYLYGSSTTDFGLLDGQQHWLVKGVKDAQVELRYDNSVKLETTSTGVQVTGKVLAKATQEPQIELQDSNSSHTGAGAETGIRFRDGGGTIQSDMGHFDSSSSNFKLNVAINADIQFSTNNTNRVIIGATGLSPAANNTYDLGSTSARWRNIYTQDLQLSNEAVGDNGIDGTWGNYTIVEGESDLFLKNNRSGKTYKFNLTEVS